MKNLTTVDWDSCCATTYGQSHQCHQYPRRYLKTLVAPEMLFLTTFLRVSSNHVDLCQLNTNDFFSIIFWKEDVLKAERTQKLSERTQCPFLVGRVAQTLTLLPAAPNAHLLDIGQACLKAWAQHCPLRNMKAQGGRLLDSRCFRACRFWREYLLSTLFS